MGDNILESQATNTKKRRERQQAQLQQDELFARPDEISTEYTVDCSRFPEMKIGDTVHCYIGKDGVTVDVLKENRRVGTVGSDGGLDSLRSSLGQAAIGVFVVQTLCDITETAKIMAKKEDEAK
jgi:hypothetical protein